MIGSFGSATSNPLLVRYPIADTVTGTSATSNQEREMRHKKLECAHLNVSSSSSKPLSPTTIMDFDSMTDRELLLYMGQNLTTKENNAPDTFNGRLTRMLEREDTEEDRQDLCDIFHIMEANFYSDFCKSFIFSIFNL